MTTRINVTRRAFLLYFVVPMTVFSPLTAQLALASSFDALEVSERVLTDLCRLAGCDHDTCYWLISATREAVANAVRHGNRQRPERLVRVEYRFENDQVTIRVEDEGEGFDPGAVPDPTLPENLLRPSGRGIFYMRRFMDRVEFSRSPGGGSVVVMSRRRNGERSAK